jgi:ferric-dicitrate binding protein FerR (iron transport regulator)
MKNSVLLKFIKHTATPEEVRSVFLWMAESQQNKHYFQSLQTTWAASQIVSAMHNESPDKNSIKKIIAILPSEIKQRQLKRNVVLLTTFITSVAASLVIYFFLNTAVKPSYDYEAITTNKKSLDVLLQSHTGVEYLFNDSATTITYDKIGDALVNEDTIKYLSADKAQHTNLNTVWTPYAKRTKIQLADGTIVHLNSGSTFIYPSTFDGNSKREVYLEGEAYFEVAKEQDRKFIVQTKYKVIEVLGTKFNVLVNLQERYFETVLVEGSVGVNTNNGKMILNPSQSYSIIKDEIEIIKTVDANNYIAWINGRLKFQDHSLSDALKQIERIYNIEIKNIDTQYLNLKITGYLKVKTTAEETIKVLMQTFLDANIDVENKFNIIHK